ncbi:MAG: UvrD-helicase domain-containing protein [Alphaproteobacteria bacterium]|nr:UvrD-helicase domain-containing protein [Alphaproteobacteria bacterium]
MSAKRTGLASILFAILRPGEAKAASVNADCIELTVGSRTSEIVLGDVKAVETRVGRRWTRLTFRHAAGTVAVSGLPRTKGRTLANAVEMARTEWWRRAFAPRIDALRSVHERLKELAEPPMYMDAETFGRLARNAQTAVGNLAGCWPETLSDTPEFRTLRDILAFLEAPEDARSKANELFVAGELVRSRTLFDQIETSPLTDEQRKAVVIDEQRNLVIAAAGSGKTSVIVAKSGWLVRREYRKPSELLLLAFARDARNEMEERVRKRLGATIAREVTVRTFHSLGLAIIGEVEGKRPTLARSAESDRALFDQLRRIFADLFEDSELSQTVLEWFQGQFSPFRNEHDFESWGAYWTYIRKNDIRSLKGDVVKSYEECEIANFLYLNGIAFEYEAPYKHQTATARKQQYKPDFFLPEDDIYIEHFGLDAAGNTAPFVDQEKYLAEMEWKRQLHAEHGTVLVETFSHERADGNLIRNLSDKLAAHGVTLSPIPHDQAFAALQGQGRIDSFTRLLATFLQHFKGSRLSFEDVAKRASGLEDRERTTAFLAVFQAVFERYQAALARAGEIDFHDMISRATDHVEAGRYRNPYGYMLVDEFQDISPARARLLTALLDNTPGSQLFAVGDDWQAIFRFGGSDIAVMRQFRDRFGDFERIDLETTFRCADRIAAVATEFVLRNPAQIRKTVRATRKADRPAVHVGLPGEDGASLLKEALDRIADDARRHDAISEVLLLGRYRHLQPLNLASLAQQYPGLRFSYMTVHRAKGLEADYAVVLGLSAGKLGFPVEIADDPLINLVLSAPEAYPNAEERRLLYVALTRARRQVFLLAEGGSPSAFVMELIDDKFDVTVFGRLPDGDARCPHCREGHLERRENARDGNVFYGCSNWPYCEHTGRPCPKCGTGLPVKSGDAIRCRDCGGSIESCPECGGWLETKMGRFGRFLGCSNYPDCNFTRNLQPSRNRQESRSRRRN